jgi:hypothetical protein
MQGSHTTPTDQLGLDERKGEDGWDGSRMKRKYDAKRNPYRSKEQKQQKQKQQDTPALGSS